MSTSLKVAMHESEDDSSDSDVCSSIFSDKSSRKDKLDMSYEESHSAQNTLRNVSQRRDMGIQRIKNDSKKRRNHIFAEIRLSTPFRPFFDALL